VGNKTSAVRRYQLGTFWGVFLVPKTRRVFDGAMVAVMRRMTHQDFYVNCLQSKYCHKTPSKANPLPENLDTTSSSGTSEAPRQKP
jgi:hypothetical protein